MSTYHFILYHLMYIGGVNWVTVGQMTNSQGQLDNGKLLSKLHTVILRMDKNKTYRPPNVEAATDYLQQVRFVSTRSLCVFTVMYIYFCCV